MQLTDPYYLKEEALKHIQEFAGNIWTDHNLHDPGIIILEQLCYALTDLNYKTSFEMADLLERPSPIRDQTFFSPRDILPARPTTAGDFRKLLLDVNGVKNAWVVPGQLRNPVYYNENNTSLSFTSWKQEDHNASDQLKVQGILDVLLAFEVDEEGDDLNNNKLIRQLSPKFLLVVEFPRWDSEEVEWADAASIRDHITSIKRFKGEEFKYLHELTENQQSEINQVILDEMIPSFQIIANKAHAIRDEVIQVLHNNRNLAQDFGKVAAIKSEDIGITSEIEIDGDVDIEGLLAEMLFRLNEHLAPPTQFHTLSELRSRGLQMDQIFDGPPLKHGFLLEEELPNQLTSLRTSDLINIMMDIPGVVAVKNFHAASYPEGVLFRSAQRWCVRLNPDLNYSPRIAPERVDLHFFVDGLPIAFDLVSALDKFNEKLSEQTRRKYPVEIDVDLTQPTGAFREIDRYYTIQNEFSGNFGIGEEGLSADASEERRVQAHQLKSYLLIFEQLMANYTSQLSAIPELFSIGPDISQTLYGQLPLETPGIETLLISLNEAEDLEEAKSQAQDKVEKMLEDHAAFIKRRKSYLNHLLGRFGEDISENALLKFSDDSSTDMSEIVNKARVLQHLTEISTHRGGGLNYFEGQHLGSFQKRIYALAGIEDIEWKRLATKSGRNAEGFHVVEHLLLRPLINDVEESQIIKDAFFQLFQQPEDPWSDDPYSSIVTVVIPDWPERFENPDFKNYLEKTIHLQAPSHVHVIIQWVNEYQMGKFEVAYFQWLEQLPNALNNKKKYSSSLTQLLEVMNKWVDRKAPKTPDHIEYEGEPILENDNVWELDASQAKWVIGSDGFIKQGNSIGFGSHAIAGEGAILMLRDATRVGVEAIRARFIPGDDPNGENGMVFDFLDSNNYKMIFYANHSNEMVLAENVGGTIHVLMSSPVKDLSQKEVRIEIQSPDGKLHIKQSSPGLIGTEFLLAENGKVSGNRIGFFNRYCQKTSFTHLELIDSEQRNRVLPPPKPSSHE